MAFSLIFMQNFIYCLDSVSWLKYVAQFAIDMIIQQQMELEHGVKNGLVARSCCRFLIVRAALNKTRTGARQMSSFRIWPLERCPAIRSAAVTNAMA
jgi:hypothetical protein